jgi:hypothetical protein
MQYLRDTLGNLVALVPKVLLFIVILVVGWIIARLVGKAIATVLNKVGFDRTVERGGLRRWMGTYQASQLAGRIVYYALMLMVLWFAFGAFGPNPISDLLRAVVGFLPRIFVALVILVIAAAIASAVKDVITSALGGLSYGPMLGTFAQVVILVLGIIAALSQVGVATTVTGPVLIAILATIAGVIVVGVGGGLVMPMRDRWERMLTRSEAEMGTLRTWREQRSRTATTPAAGAPQPAYTGQRTGAAEDPTRTRTTPASEEPTAQMPQAGTTAPGGERRGGYRQAP